MAPSVCSCSLLAARGGRLPRLMRPLTHFQDNISLEEVFDNLRCSHYASKSSALRETKLMAGTAKCDAMLRRINTKASGRRKWFAFENKDSRRPPPCVDGGGRLFLLQHRRRSAKREICCR